MTKSNQTLYREICREKGDTLSIFAQDWWWDAVAGPDNWDVLIVYNDGIVVATMPYLVTKKKAFFRFLTLPALTKHAPITLFYPKYSSEYDYISFKVDTLSKLIHDLPNFDHFQMNMPYDIDYWTPFYWNGFYAQPRYHYVLELTEHENMFDKISKSTRKQIKKGMRNLKLEISDTTSEIEYLVNKSYKRQLFKSPYTHCYFERIDNALKKRNLRTIYIAYDREKPISCLYIIYYNNKAYAMLSGLDYEARKKRPVEFLFWESIKDSYDRKCTQFDFLASMHPGIEPARRVYGGYPQQYIELYKTNSPLLKVWYLLKGGAVLPP